MSKTTMKRLAMNAEAIARRQGFAKGRNEGMEEAILLEAINAKLLRALKRMERAFTKVWTVADGKEGYDAIAEARAAIGKAEDETPRLRPVEKS